LSPSLPPCYNLAVKVSELGEFGLIDLLAKMISESGRATSPQLILGIGDDAAAWRSDAAIHLVTTDSLFEGIHFTLESTPWDALGWKSLAVNLSDIAAMGGTPKYALVSLALPEDAEVDDVRALYRGMIEIAGKFQVAIVGGDTCRAPLVSLTITVFGDADSAGKMLTRSGAKHGDKIAVTGSLGAAAGGLAMLAKKMKVNNEQDAAELSRAFLRPWPRVAEGKMLVETGVRAAIDVSDGLVADLTHICRASGVGARVEVERVSVSPALKVGFGSRALGLALSGGEDYELLFTASQDVMANVQKAAACPITVIGDITAENAGQVGLVDASGKPVHVSMAGWEHFKK